MYVWPSKFRLNYQRALVHGTICIRGVYTLSQRAPHMHMEYRETWNRIYIQFGGQTIHRIQICHHCTTENPACDNDFPKHAAWEQTRVLILLESKYTVILARACVCTRSREFICALDSVESYIVGRPYDTRARGKLKRKTKSLFTMMTRRQPSSTNWIQRAEYTKIISRSSSNNNNDQIFVYADITFHAAVNAGSTGVGMEHAVVLIPKTLYLYLFYITVYEYICIIDSMRSCVYVQRKTIFGLFYFFFTKMFAYNIQREIRLNVILARSG